MNIIHSVTKNFPLHFSINVFCFPNKALRFLAPYSGPPHTSFELF